MTTTPNAKGHSRRTFLQHTTKGAAAAALATTTLATPACQAQAASKPVPPPTKAKSFNAAAWGILDAAQDVLLPGKENGGVIAGARDVNAIQYLDWALTHPRWAWPKKRLIGLANWLQRQAKKQHRAPFAELRFKQRDLLLQDACNTEHKRAVRLLLDATLEALLSDPVHGGNAKEAGWTTTGYTPAWPRPASREQVLTTQFPT